MFFMPYIDPIYLLLVVVCLVISGIAGAVTKSRFKWASQIPTRRGMTGAEVAKAILYHSDIHDVEIVEHRGFLSDHYNPKDKVLALSPQNFHGRSVAAAGIAAHEVGHAIQHARAYAPLGLRSVLVPVASIGSNLGPWLIIAAIIMGALQGSTAAEAGGFTTMLAYGGVALFGAGTLFTLITLPVEFDASARAKRLLPELGLTSNPEEDAGVAKVLNAAAMTYVAAAITSLLMLLYWAWRAGLLGGGRH